MLPAANRLIKKDDFQRVIQRGRPFSFENILLKVAGNNLDKTRIGFLVGKKTAKDAVGRSGIKRALRGAFLQNIEDIKPGLDIVVTCRFHQEKNKKTKFDGKKIKNFLAANNLLKKIKKDVS